MADKVVLFEAGQAGPPFLQSAGANCEFKVDFYNAPFSLTPKDLQSLFELWIFSTQDLKLSCAFLQAYPDLGHSLSKEELLYLESWIKSRLNASQEKDG